MAGRSRPIILTPCPIWSYQYGRQVTPYHTNINHALMPLSQVYQPIILTPCPYDPITGRARAARRGFYPGPADVCSVRHGHEAWVAGPAGHGVNHVRVKPYGTRYGQRRQHAVLVRRRRLPILPISYRIFFYSR